MKMSTPKTDYNERTHPTLPAGGSPKSVGHLLSFDELPSLDDLASDAHHPFDDFVASGPDDILPKIDSPKFMRFDTPRAGVQYVELFDAMALADPVGPRVFCFAAEQLDQVSLPSAVCCLSIFQFLSIAGWLHPFLSSCSIQGMGIFGLVAGIFMACIGDASVTCGTCGEFYST